VGWTANGKRPSFDLVSGVSTGALIAPFAFLGSDYDQALSEIYTSNVTGDIVQIQFLPAALLNSGILRSEPLRNLVEKFADEKLLAAIASEHVKGRRLIMVTTNMDAQRGVVWDMGKIAASGRPEALALFRDIMVASVSVPAEFPPVLIDVQANGKHFQEMHADGGPSIQVLTVPEGLLAEAGPSLLPNGTRAELYVIVNNALIPEFKVTPQSTFAVGYRGLDTMIKAETRDALYATYAFTKRTGIGFHIASIGFRTMPLTRSERNMWAPYLSSVTTKRYPETSGRRRLRSLTKALPECTIQPPSVMPNKPNSQSAIAAPTIPRQTSLQSRR
jgi:Patatin-like phospholipase